MGRWRKGKERKMKGEEKREIWMNVELVKSRPISREFYYNSYRSHERALLHT